MLRQMGVFVALKKPPSRPANTADAGFSFAQSEAAMSAPTIRISAQLVRDLNDCLARLRLARTMCDEADERVFTRRLDWLLEKVPRPKTSPEEE